MTSPHENPAASEGHGAVRPATTTDLVATDAVLRDRVAALERIQAQAQELGGRVLGRAEQYSTILDMVADGFCLLDKDGRFLDVNDAYCRMSGYTRQELLAIGLADVETVDTHEDTVRRIQEIVRTGSARFEGRHRRKNGELVDLDISATFLRANGGRFSCLLRDITGRKAAARTLERRTHQLETVRAVAEEITRELDLARLLDLILRRAMELVGASTGVIRLWDDSTQMLVPAATQDEGRLLWPLRLGEGVSGIAAERHQGMIVNDFRTSPYATPRHLEQTTFTAILAEPLLYRERLVGVIAVGHKAPKKSFCPEEALLLRLLATQAAIAIENARLHLAAVHKGEELGALLRATHSVMAGLKLQHTLEVIASEAARIAHCEHVKLLLVDPDAQVLRIGVLRGLVTPDGFPLAVGTGLSGMVAQSGQPLYIADTQNDPRSLLAAFDRALGLRTYLGLPIKIRDEILGVLTFNTSEPRQYTADELAYLASFADQAAIAIENARLHEAANRRAERLATLNALNRTLTTTTEPEQVAQQILAALEILIPGSVARLWLWDSRQPDDFRLAASAGLRDPAAAQALVVRPTEGLVGLALTTRQAVTSSDLVTDPRFIHKSWAEVEGLRSSVTLPLVHGDQVHGVLAVSTRVRHEFDGEEVELLWSFAAQATIALENARLFAELKRAYEDLSRAQDELVRSEKLRALGQMAAGIAHDLNNILAAILGQTDLLRLRVSELPVHEALNTLELAATDAAEVVRRLQEFSRQQASQPLVPVDLAATVGEVLEITRPRWKDDPQQRGVVIEARLGLADLPPVLGYAHEIREALTNLILNAVDAMPHGGALTIAAHERAEADGRAPKKSHTTMSDAQGATVDGRVVELTITDTGVGMTTEVRQRIFDPFFTTKGVKGTGLGLSVVYGIMQRHGGQIEVASSPGQGTTFTLRFRVAAGAV